MAKNLLKRKWAQRPSLKPPGIFQLSPWLSVLGFSLHILLLYLLKPVWITFCSNEVVEIKTTNLLFTTILSCTVNKSIYLNSHVPVLCGMELMAKATILKWPEVQIWPGSQVQMIAIPRTVVQPNHQLPWQFRFRTHWASILKQSKCLGWKRRIVQGLFK